MGVTAWIDPRKQGEQVPKATKTPRDLHALTIQRCGPLPSFRPVIGLGGLTARIQPQLTLGRELNSWPSTRTPSSAPWGSVSPTLSKRAGPRTTSPSKPGLVALPSCTARTSSWDTKAPAQVAKCVPQASAGTGRP